VGIILKEIYNDWRTSQLAMSFKKDSLGRDVFFPHSLKTQGYIVPDSVKAKYENLYFWSLQLLYGAVFAVPLGFLNVWIYIFAFSFIIIWPFLVIRSAVKNLEKSNEKKLESKEDLLAGIRSIGLFTLILCECFSLYTLIYGVESNTLGNLIIGSILSILFSASIVIKIKYLRVTNGFPATWKEFRYTTFKILLSYSVIVILFSAWISLVHLSGYWDINRFFPFNNYGSD
jgi:hypothetical protein